MKAAGRYEDNKYNVPVNAPTWFQIDKYDGQPPAKKQPTNYLILSIIMIIICPPAGAVATILSVLSNQERVKGDMVNAQRLSNLALTVCIIGLVLGICFWVALLSTCLISDYQLYPKRCTIFSFRNESYINVFANRYNLPLGRASDRGNK